MFRLSLDVPYRLIVRPAYERAQHAVDFSIDTSADIYHDANAGLLILRPSCLDRRSTQNLVPITQLEYQGDHWRRANRGLMQATRGEFLARIFSATSIELLVMAAIIALEGAPRMKWVIRTATELLRDESFALHITCPDDEFGRDDDYFMLNWDRYGLAMDTRGMLSFWLYDRDNMQDSPKRLAQWYSGVSAPVRNALTVAAIPVPPLGLLVLTLTSGGTNTTLSSSSSTSRQLAGSKLIPLADLMENIGTESAPVWSLAPESQLNVGINTNYNPILSIERIRYPESGYAIERPHPLPPIAPQVPTAVPIIAYTHNQAASVSLLLQDGSAWNTAQSPTAYRVRIDMQADAARVYTPVVVAHFTRCEPIITTRATSPVMVRTLKELELTFDEYAREEGIVEIIDTNPAVQQILARGDTTYLLELKEGTQWVPISGGFARVEQHERMQSISGQYPHRARLKLEGMWARLAEVHMLSDTAFDGITLAKAFNKLLEGAGLEPIPDSDLPPPLQAIRMPTVETGDTSGGWRYAPRLGQSGDEILRTLMLFALATGQEWRLRYQLAPAFKWVLEPKPDGLPPWTLTARERDLAARTIPYAQLETEPEPPEANLIWVEGATAPSKEGERLVVQLLNTDSLTNPASLDYLGRIVLVRLQSDALSNMDHVQLLAERIYECVARHAFKARAVIPLAKEQVPLTRELWQLLPRKVVIRESNSIVLGEAYVKRATLTARVEPKMNCSIELEMESRYASDPRNR